MKTGWRMLLGWAVCMAGASVGWAQGSLTPPGAPAPTMKTLAQVEPRTPITNAPCTITQAGSYYLTANLTSTGHGVVVAVGGVTLDLMGFTLAGDRDGADYGVFLDGTTNAPIRDVVIRNGGVRDFGAGVRVEYGFGCRVEQVIVSDNAEKGVFLEGVSGQCDGNRIADCTIRGNGSDGLFLHGAVGQCNGNIIADCTISDNGGAGVYLDGAFGRCEENIISGCAIRKNADKGVALYEADGNRVENNHISAQVGAATYGIYSTGSAKNLILRNTCVGQTNNYSFTPNDTYGPIVTDTGALPLTGAPAHPWANFSR